MAAISIAAIVFSVGVSFALAATNETAEEAERASGAAASTPPGGLVEAGFDASLKDMQGRDLSSTSGLGGAMILRNDRLTAMRVVAITYDIAGDRHSVSYGTEGACNGEAFDLPAGGTIPIIFIIEIPGEKLMESAAVRDKAMLQATDAEGNSWPISVVEPTSIQDEQLAGLYGLCADELGLNFFSLPD